MVEPPSIPVETQLHLVLAIVILAVFSAVVGLPPDAVSAVFACVSLPATYALAYYRALAPWRRAFVRRRGGRPASPWAVVATEMTAVVFSYVSGYIVYALSVQSPSLNIYTAAFAATMAMRLFLRAAVAWLAGNRIDPANPLVAFTVSAAAAVLGTAVLAAMLGVLPPEPL